MRSVRRRSASLAGFECIHHPDALIENNLNHSAGFLIALDQ